MTGAGLLPSSSSIYVQEITSTTESKQKSSSSTDPKLNLQLDSVFRRTNAGSEQGEHILKAKEAFIQEKLHEHRQKIESEKTEKLAAINIHPVPKEEKPIGIISINSRKKNELSSASIQENNTTNLGVTSTSQANESATQKDSPSLSAKDYLNKALVVNMRREEKVESVTLDDVSEGGERWLTGISEIHLPLSVKIANIERTELAKKEAVRNREKQLYNLYLNSDTATGALLQLPLEDIPLAQQSNISSNFQKSYNDSSDLRNAAYFTMQSSTLLDNTKIKRGSSDMSRDDLDNQDLSEETRKKMAYEKARAYDLYLQQSSLATDDKAVKRYVKNTRK